MNRENKRRSFEKGYYKTHACTDAFTCKVCGRLCTPENPMKLMSIAMRPLCEPPFPLERIEEMTALMGGDGSLK